MHVSMAASCSEFVFLPTWQCESIHWFLHRSAVLEAVHNKHGKRFSACTIIVTESYATASTFDESFRSRNLVQRRFDFQTSASF